MPLQLKHYLHPLICSHDASIDMILQMKVEQPSDLSLTWACRSKLQSVSHCCNCLPFWHRFPELRKFFSLAHKLQLLIPFLYVFIVWNILFLIWRNSSPSPLTSLPVLHCFLPLPQLLCLALAHNAMYNIDSTLQFLPNFFRVLTNAWQSMYSSVLNYFFHISRGCCTKLALLLTKMYVLWQVFVKMGG